MMAAPHIIVCGTESEISIVVQQHLAVSALLARVDRVCSAGALNEETEGELRGLTATVRAAFKLPMRGADQ